MSRWAVAVVVAMLAAVSYLSGQEASQPNDCSHRSIPLTVIKNSNPTWDWHSLNLSVAGRQIPINSVLVAPQSPRVLVLVDTSGSMAKYSGVRATWGTGLRAAAFAVDATPLDSSVSLGTFNEQNRFSQFESRQEAAKEVAGLAQHEPSHHTALYDALKDAAARLNPTQFGDVIFLVTDGGDNHSAERQKKAQQELNSRGVRVFVFLVFDKDFKTAEEREAPELMSELASATGGAVFEEPWSKEWVASDEGKQVMQRIRTMARWPYMLQFRLDQPLQKPAKLRITAPDKHSVELAYPHEVLPCFALAAKSQ